MTTNETFLLRSLMFTQMRDVLWCVVLCILVMGVVDGLRDVQLVLPPVVRAGTTATLLCLFNMENAPLYSVSWSRGTREFYRYVPRNRPPKQVFPFPGITVDVESSNMNQVSLRRVPLHLAGTFTCEVSADAPYFTSISVSDRLTVIDIPDTRPEVTLENGLYNEYEPLEANCTFGLIKYPSTLTFYVNNEVVAPHLVNSWDGGATLNFTPHRSDFSPHGEMRLKCALSVLGQYHLSSNSVSVWLRTNGAEEPSAIAGTAVTCDINLLGLCLLIHCSFLSTYSIL